MSDWGSNTGAKVVSWRACRANRIIESDIDKTKAAWDVFEEMQFNYHYVLQLQPSARRDDEKPLNVLNNAVFLDIFILFSSCWLLKSDSK